MHVNIEGWSGYLIGFIVTISLIAILIIGFLGFLYILTECGVWLINRIKPNLESKRLLALWLLNRKKITKYIKENEYKLENNPYLNNNERLPLPITNQKMWQMANVIIERQKKCIETTPDTKIDFKTLEGEWFDWLEEELFGEQP